MKAAEFDYVSAESLDQVCELLAVREEERVIIAGGQTLVPLMAMRLAQPSMLIDINRIAELQGISAEDDWLSIKACTRQREAELSQGIRNATPLLAKALRFVGHQQTRNRGTIGGSLAHADPAAEIPLIAAALDATLESRGTRGDAQRPASEFFQDALTTALPEDEVLTAVRLPVWRHDGILGTGFQELSGRASNFAIAAAAVQLVLDGDGVCTRLTLAIGGVETKPVKANGVLDELVSTKLDADAVEEVCREFCAGLDPMGDIHADAQYRHQVACVMAQRAIVEARDEALGALA